VAGAVRPLPAQAGQEALEAEHAGLVERREAAEVAGDRPAPETTRVVIPPAAAALVAVPKPSHSVLPGSQTCTCESTSPGSNTTSGPSSTARRPQTRLASGSTAAIRPEIF
jgi:hypothetical protein